MTEFRFAATKHHLMVAHEVTNPGCRHDESVRALQRKVVISFVYSGASMIIAKGTSCRENRWSPRAIPPHSAIRLSSGHCQEPALAAH
jgi:hypothetical protein